METDPAKYLTSLAFEDCWTASEAVAPVNCKKLQLGIAVSPPFAFAGLGEK